MGMAAHPPALTVRHHRRLRAMYRSSGWPCQDALEVDLLVAGLLERVHVPGQLETLRVTDAGLAVLAGVQARNRAALTQHETLVQRIADDQVRAGRIAYQGLTLLSKPGDAWLQLRPDVYSIRNTTREDRLEPVIHEIKVSRADLKADLRRPEKRGGYQALASACYYVLAEGIGEADDVPAECGVIIARPDRLDCVRPAPTRLCGVAFSTWMTLAKSTRHTWLEPSMDRL
jgi:hypothetical protein